MKNTKVEITIDEKTHPNKVLFNIKYDNQVIEFGIPRKYIEDATFDINNYVTELLKGKQHD